MKNFLIKTIVIMWFQMFLVSVAVIQIHCFCPSFGWLTNNQMNAIYLIVFVSSMLGGVSISIAAHERII